jgi:hypothetical protein
MKAQLFLVVALLVSSIFATAFAIAEETSIDIENLSTISTNSTDVENALNETENHIGNGQYKRLGFTTILRGSGWATDSDDGFLVSVFWLNQKYYKDNEKNSKTASFGELKIIGVGNYKLVRTTDESNLTTNATENKYNFYLVPNGLKTRNTNESKDNSVGNLTLTKEKEYSNFVKWSGTIKLDSGAKEGSYDVELATVKDTVKPVVAAAVAGAMKDVKKEAKTSFWSKMKFWKQNKGNNSDKYNNKDKPNEDNNSDN